MNYRFTILIILMVGFVHAECSDIDNQEDCERMDGCEWIESDNMYNDSMLKIKLIYSI